MKIEYINGCQVITHPSGHISRYTADDHKDYLDFLNAREADLHETIISMNEVITRINHSVITEAELESI